MRICAVIVTYNRLDKLKTCLRCFAEQIDVPAELIVVNNASTDGTEAYLAEWRTRQEGFAKTVINCTENLGGSGGFYTGLAYAVTTDHEWVWVSDDDAYPDADAFHNAYAYLEGHQGQNIAAICGEVRSKGVITYSHRKTYSVKGPLVEVRYSTDADYEQEAFAINGFSYVGTIMNMDKLREAGLTDKEYFIWFDDTEHSLRMSKYGDILCIPSIKIDHDVDDSGEGLSWKHYYGYRNNILLHKRHFPGMPGHFFVFKQMIMAVYLTLFSKNPELVQLFRKALKDGRSGVEGKDEYYRPGWKPSNKEMDQILL